MKRCRDCGIRERTQKDLEQNPGWREILFYECTRCGGFPLCENCADYYSNVPRCEHGKEKNVSKTKKKVIALVIDTELTNEQIEQGEIRLHVVKKEGKDSEFLNLTARNVRVLDSD